MLLILWSIIAFWVRYAAFESHLQVLRMQIKNQPTNLDLPQWQYQEVLLKMLHADHRDLQLQLSKHVYESDYLAVFCSIIRFLNESY